MITLKMYDEKWKIKINEEEMEFDKTKEFEEVLKKLIEYKDKYSRIKEQ